MYRRATRSLFNLSKAKKKLEQNQLKSDEPFHHEYSIRPDTYAFKVDATNEKSRSLAKSTSPPSEQPLGFKSHPLQGSGDDFNFDENKFNLIEFIYRYSTNYPFGIHSPQEVFSRYPQTTLEKLRRFRSRPKRTKLLVLDYIEDSLYNPHYGYFSKEVEIFHQDKPFDYNNINDIDEFLENWQNAYAKYDELAPVRSREVFNETQQKATTSNPTNSKFVKRALDIQDQDSLVVKSGKGTNRRSMQLWHTPTELFSPYYGEAIARYLLENNKGEELVIYEMGAGNGTLMCNILSYIKREAPHIYARTQYRIIEISSQLAEKQLTHALRTKLFSQGLDLTKLKIENISIFDWKTVVEKPCFFIALEVFDNFAHDLIRYDNATGVPLEGQVLIDDHGDFYEFFTPQLSYWSNAYLNLRENGPNGVLKSAKSVKGRLATAKLMIPLVPKQDVHPLHQSTLKLQWQNSLFPFKDNMTPGEFIPTRLLQFFQILKHKFPNHKLVCSDFNKLPHTIPGYFNGPVVQTVLQDKMVDVLTYMVMQGYFDIMFGTDFVNASAMYQQVVGKPAAVQSHKQFLTQWADVPQTTTKTGENPMLDFYTNVLFMCS